MTNTLAKNLTASLKSQLLPGQFWPRPSFHRLGRLRSPAIGLPGQGGVRGKLLLLLLLLLFPFPPL